ncbi:MAG: hypothetical protein HOL01_18425 [Planctomycetaceae bacterium]|jgi:4-amino-4-deoxy-L-arabinose transferase-like glycosyltransferase|nr:hypothetical protein [Planctomycetaceae bacterium]MBT6485714.1 hypothetical protein [Planctomycetaceae bacterium]MBT6496513.1 hypothetical protein [Planctomycetaceae bacterium]
MLAVVRRNPLLFILLSAMLLRVVAALIVHDRLQNVWKRDFVIAGDAYGYWELGRKMAVGDEFSLYSPPRQVHRMPGFPAVLAVSMKLFGPSFLAARLLLAVVGMLACWMVFLLGREVFDESVGLMAAGFAAVAPVMVGFSVLILSETLFALCLLGSLYWLAKLIAVGSEAGEQRRAIAYSLTAGVMVAIAVYVRPSWLLAAPFFAIGIVVLSDNKKQAVVRGLLLSTAAFAALLPWAYRNHQVSGHWVFTTLWAGPSLYDGLNPEATGDSDMAFYDRDKLGQRMTEYEVDQHYRKKALQFVEENPDRSLQLAVVKAGRYWKPWPNAAQFDHMGYRFGVAVFFVPLVMLAARGWWVYRRRAWAWLLTLGPVLYFFALHLIFVGSLRYRLPAEYPLCVLSAAGLHSWIGNGESKSE